MNYGRNKQSLFGVRMYKFDTNIKKCSISQFGSRGLSDWQVRISESERSRLGQSGLEEVFM